MLPELKEKSKIKKIVPTQDWTHNLQIISPMLYQLC